MLNQAEIRQFVSLLDQPHFNVKKAIFRLTEERATFLHFFITLSVPIGFCSFNCLFKRVPSCYKVDWEKAIAYRLTIEARRSFTKVWFPLSRTFCVRTHVKFTRVNETEATFERPRVRNFYVYIWSSIHYLYFINACKIYVSAGCMSNKPGSYIFFSVFDISYFVKLDFFSFFWGR